MAKEQPKLQTEKPRILIDETMAPEALLLQMHRLVDKKAARVLGINAGEKVRDALYLLSELPEEEDLSFTFDDIADHWEYYTEEEQRELFRMALDAGVLVRDHLTKVRGTPNWSYVRIGDKYFEVGDRVRINTRLVRSIVKIMDRE